MSAELAPHPENHAPARVATKTAYRRGDRLRWEEYARLRGLGVDGPDSWELVAFDPKIGIRWMIEARARGELRPAELLRTHDRFLKRMESATGESVACAIRATIRARGVEIAEALVGSALGGDVNAQKHALALAGAVVPREGGVTVNGPAQFNFAGAAKSRASGG